MILSPKFIISNKTVFVYTIILPGSEMTIA